MDQALEADPRKSKGRDTGLAGLLAFITFLWFIVAAVGFGVLQQTLLDRIKNEHNLVDALQAVAWPFVWFALGLPAAFILINYMRQLISLKNALEQAPEKLELSIKTAQEYFDNIDALGARINNDMSATLDAWDSRVSSLKDQAQELQLKEPTDLGFARDVPTTPSVAPTAPSGEQVRPDRIEREELSVLVDYASAIFYPLVEKWNSDGRRRSNILRVSAGGGNRPVLARELLERRVIPFDPDTNNLVAKFMEETFQEHLGARRRLVEKATVDRLKSMRTELEQRNVTPESIA